MPFVSIPPTVTVIIFYSLPGIILIVHRIPTVVSYAALVVLGCLLTRCLSLRVFQKAVEEESQVRKSSADLFSPGGKSADPDPARKVSRRFPSIHPILSSPPTAPTSPHRVPLPRCDTQVSSQGRRPHPD